MSTMDMGVHVSTLHESTYNTELQEAACFSPKGLQPSCYGLMLLQTRNNGVIDNFCILRWLELNRGYLDINIKTARAS